MNYLSLDDRPSSPFLLYKRRLNKPGRIDGKFEKRRWTGRCRVSDGLNLESSAIKSKGTKNVQAFLNRSAIELSAGDAPNAITFPILRRATPEFHDTKSAPESAVISGRSDFVLGLT